MGGGLRLFGISQLTSSGGSLEHPDGLVLVTRQNQHLLLYFEKVALGGPDILQQTEHLPCTQLTRTQSLAPRTLP